jgi:hypothetical protein
MQQKLAKSNFLLLHFERSRVYTCKTVLKENYFNFSFSSQILAFGGVAGSVEYRKQCDKILNYL